MIRVELSVCICSCTHGARRRGWCVLRAAVVGWWRCFGFFECRSKATHRLRGGSLRLRPSLVLAVETLWRGWYYVRWWKVSLAYQVPAAWCRCLVAWSITECAVSTPPPQRRSAGGDGGAAASPLGALLLQFAERSSCCKRYRPQHYYKRPYQRQQPRQQGRHHGQDARADAA